MGKRLIIPISFLDEDTYNYVKNKPNSSHYIRELVAKDRKNQVDSDIKSYINKQIEEALKQLPNSEKTNDFKESVKDMLNMYK